MESSNQKDFIKKLIYIFIKTLEDKNIILLNYIFLLIFWIKIKTSLFITTNKVNQYK